MKINAHILANRTQEVPIPVPVEPVEATITLNGSFRYDYHMRKYENTDRGVTYPDYEADITTWRSGSVQRDTNSGEYWRTQGYDTIPCNVGGNSNGTWATFYAEGEGFWNGRHDVYDYMNYYGPTGSFTVSGLQAGKYVFQLIHWFGYQSDSEKRVVRVDGSKGRIVKSGTHGVIEGIVYPEVVTYTGGQGDLAKGKVIKAVIRYAFTVSEGETTKTFEFGRGKDISFEDLWDSVYMTEGDSSVWANCSSSFNAKVFTNGGNG